MPASGLFTAIGLMSGTSLDGVDAALITTDGRFAVTCGPALTVPYAEPTRARLRAVLGCAPGERAEEVAAAARDITQIHADAVRLLLRESATPARAVDVIGFHGHTILHRPRAGLTVQIGDGAMLAALTGIDVVDDFRSRDVAEGGEGAPLVPLFHMALASGLERPLAVLNLGGVANVTWIGVAADPIAFDTGPGNALLDDWVLRHTGAAFDADGALAAMGQPDRRVLARLLANPYFDRRPPKSLDRGDFALEEIEGLPPADGAATLVAFTAEAAAYAFGHFPEPPRRVLVAGGGRKNRALMAALGRALPCPVVPVEDVGWNGDALEAQAFGYLAVRSLLKLPVSLPSITGARRPVTGGRLHRAGAT
jgi:anhydro-N-acetylmuramic acid kinase